MAFVLLTFQHQRIKDTRGGCCGLRDDGSQNTGWAAVYPNTNTTTTAIGRKIRIVFVEEYIVLPLGGAQVGDLSGESKLWF